MRGWMVAMVAAALCACGSDVEKKKANNGGDNNAGTTNNGATNNGTTSNNGVSSNNGTTSPGERTCYGDADEDGAPGTATVVETTCAAAGLAEESLDCDDEDATRYPGAAEACDGVDLDCDGVWNASVPAVCPTIQSAIDVAAEANFTGDIAVAAGTYRENIVFRGKAVRVVGAGAATTTIDGSDGDDAVVRFEAGEVETTILEGFTITGGSGVFDGESREGGGIYINEASPTLRNLVVRNNRAAGDSGYGGGIHIGRFSDAVLERVDVIGNRATYYGGGIHISQSKPKLRQVRIIDNSALYGGGLANYFSTSSIVSTIFAGNEATFGGGALVQGEDIVPFYQVHFVGNIASDEGGGAKLLGGSNAGFENTNFSGNSAPVGGAIDNEAGNPSLHYANFFDNGENALNNLSVSSFEGVIYEPPGLISVAGDAETWDLHLAPGSALIDAGDVSDTDVDGTRADIGAYGGSLGDW